MTDRSVCQLLKALFLSSGRLQHSQVMVLFQKLRTFSKLNSANDAILHVQHSSLLDRISRKGCGNMLCPLQPHHHEAGSYPLANRQIPSQNWMKAPTSSF
eukprot:TRINITY_DN10762_c0_g1_i1.p2 TRINITY_DN10762_c0_g1~~TRINITY_DN10762_c0_g1_i1.p2  ORF type:complete len:100 (+),score=3.36 TRINITY_DN10762_c0_g1_i1:39-338(+)